MNLGRVLAIWLILATLGASCAPATRNTEPGSVPVPRSTAPKRLVASIFADPAGMHQELTNRGGVGSVPGMNELHHLLHAGLSVQDDREVYQPWLAEALPSIENGLWTVAPDGRMATTWRMKPGIVWHDGTPFSTDSLTLALDINRDREIGVVTLPVLDQIEAVETPDPRTITVRWARPFIEADQLFSQGFVMPVPAHLVQSAYQEDKKSLFNLPYWREEYVGLGPFKLQEWVPGSAMTLVANDRYALGRPKLDQMEIRFIKEINTIIANLMAGSVEKHLGRGFGVEQLLQVRDAAPDMNVQVGGGLLSDPIPMFTQFVDTDPPLVTNLEFRRALLEAIDRQEMTDSLNYGLGPIAHTWLQPDRPEFPAVESRIVRYGYDPRRSAQTIERLGYTKGADGIFRSAQGEPLKLELRTTDQRLIQPRSAFSVADYWKRLGVDVTTNNVPNQLIPDREYRSGFPAFELVAGGITARSTAVSSWLGSASPLPETRFVGGNRSRYRNPELDSFITRYVTTVPVSERLAALGDVIHHQTENLTMMTLFYEGSVILLGAKRLKGVTSQRVWNAHLWDVE
jgi:peptide/nickel transport system substrate-binding protein